MPNDEQFYNVNVRFEWDRANTEHVKRHDITPLECEQAILTDPLIADFQNHPAEERCLCFGRTDAGRLLTVIYTERAGAIRVVTAYPMTKQQEAIYFESQLNAE